MFHVEHMSKTHLIVFLCLLFTIVGCDRPDPDPEKRDPIYADLLKQAAEIKSDVAASEKELETNRAELKAVVPQSGQNKYAVKRVVETQARIEKLKQLQQFFELKAESRKKWDQEAYLKAFKLKQTWPLPEEYKTYQAQKKLEMAPRAWNLRERIDQAKLGISLKPKASEAESKESE